MISDAFGSNHIPFRKVPFVELRSVIKNRFPSLDILAWRRLTLWSFNTRSTAPAIFPTVIGRFCNGIWYLLLLYRFISRLALIFPKSPERYIARTINIPQSNPRTSSYLFLPKYRHTLNLYCRYSFPNASIKKSSSTLTICKWKNTTAKPVAK